MPDQQKTDAADGTSRRRLFFGKGAVPGPKRVRRILQLAGYDIGQGEPDDENDLFAVWRQNSAATPPQAADETPRTLLHVEDAFLRPVLTDGITEPPMGLLLDTTNPHFNPARPSDLENLLATHPLDDTALLNRARTAAERLKAAHISNYNAHDPALPLPAPGYVLVLDQPKGDAAVIASKGNTALFHEMLVFAQEEHPGARVIIKPHPETLAGRRPGHFSASDASTRVSLMTEPVSPWALMEGAIGVYTVSSQLGFEAIFAGHKPRIFGQPFYAGWGLTQDEHPVDRRQRKLSRAQLFAAAMILYPKWYDPYRDKLCELEQVIDTLEAMTRCYREDSRGHIATHMHLWKRAPLQAFYGRYKKLRFTNKPAKAIAMASKSGADIMVWAGRETGQFGDLPLKRIEDGFLRSRGLGADLNAPLSLVADDLGIYYDPSRPSRLETLIADSVNLPEHALERAKALIESLTRDGLSKYNIGSTTLPDLPKGRRILVPGQVEDDASILKGCANIRSNLDLLARTRAENPDAVILFKPHPDVEAGLRAGAISPDEAGKYADIVITGTDPAALISVVDEVWTMTSLLGFEALLRGCKVTCLGQPFYAGWGLTHDLTAQPDRRQARPALAGLVHATLIDYPRYYDPVADLPAPAEVIAERLHNSTLPQERISMRILAKLQGMFASYAYLWR